MKHLNYPFYLMFLLCFSATVSAQYITVDENVSIDGLVTDILVDNPCVNVSNISFSTWEAEQGSPLGYFTAGTSNFPFTDGILLTTGIATKAVGPNNFILSDGPSTWGGDSDLEEALGIGGSSINATSLEFDFLPLANKISFDYIFSSEQYLSNPSQNQCNFTDGFVFLLKEVGGTSGYQNLAVVPGTTIPVKTSTVRGPGTICPEANADYFDAFNGSNHPTNYNGQTVIMKAQATVTPGVLYHIKLVVSDQGNNLYDSAIFLGAGSFKVEKDLGADRLIATDNPACVGENPVLDATEPGTNTYQWFKNTVAIPGATNATYTVLDAGDYSVEISLNASGCISTGSIKIEYAPNLTPNQATIVQCDDNNDGIAAFNLSKATAQIIAGDSSIEEIVFYENPTDISPINNAANYSSVPKTIYAKVINEYGCFEFVEVFLEISNNTVTTPSPIILCDEDATKDGINEFDLNAEITPIVTNGLPAGLNVVYYSSQNDALTETNALDNLYSNATPFQEIIWARIVNGPDCYGVVSVTFIVNTFDAPNFDDELLYLCEGFNSIILAVPDNYLSYLWDDTAASTTNSISVTSPGTYSITVTGPNGCPDTKKFIVEASGKAIITSVEINDFAGGENSVLINYTGLGVYQFSLDGSNYQESPLFINVQSGVYTVYVKDINGCGVTKEEIFVLDYPKFFTPNGDGYNDIWGIDYLKRKHPNTVISVFDRFGKLLYNFSGEGDGWDGSFNATPLPASDYWFRIILEDGRLVEGHFSLKR